MINFSNRINRLIPRISTLTDQYPPTNQFGYNTPLPTQPDNQSQPIDFSAEYAKLAGNRPNRLAYQQAVEQGAPQINRGKWAKLGAALTAGASGLAGDSPANSYNLAMSSYQEPQRQSDEDYKQKLSGLERLSQFEDTDKSDAMKALEMKYNDYYKRREDTRQEDTARASIKNQQEDNDRANWHTIENKTDGNTYLYNMKTNEKRFVAKTGNTTQEDIDNAIAKAAGIAKAEEPYKINADERDTERAVKTATISANAAKERNDATNQNRLDAITAREQATAARLQNKLDLEASKPNATEEYKRMVVNLRKALTDDASLAGYVKQAPDGSIIPKEESDFWSPDDNDRAKIAKVKAAILATPSSGRGSSSRGSNTPAINDDPMNLLVR